jgi:MFS family permease
MAVPMSTAILASAYPPERRGQALGWYASAIAVGRATGPTLGGFLLYLWGWQSIFLANFVIGILVSAAVFSVFKGAEKRKSEPFDSWGALSLMIGYPALLIALSLGANSRWSSSWVAVWSVLAGGGLCSFLWIELHTKRPLIDIFLFRQRPLSAALASLAISSAAHGPITVCAPLYMQNVLASSPLTVGLIMAALPVSTALFSPVSGRAADRLEARFIATIGLAFILVGIFFYAGLRADSTYLMVVLALTLVGVGIGLFAPANQKAAFSFVESEDYGMLSAMLTSLGTAAGTLGTTTAVALIERIMSQRGTHDPVSFAAAQQSAFSSLIPLAAAALIISFVAWQWSGPKDKKRKL